MRISFKSIAVLVSGVAVVGACQHTTIADTNAQSKMAAVEASQTQSMINLKDVLDASTANIPTLTAVGYAVTSSQPGRSESQKRLMAIRSARTVRINPTGSDTYEVVLEIDRETIGYLLQTARQTV